MMGLMRTGRNMRLSPDPTHVCEVCGAEWLFSEEGGWSLLEQGKTGSVKVKIVNNVMECCGQLAKEVPPRAVAQKLPEALLIACIPVAVMGGAVLLLKLLELLFR